MHCAVHVLGQTLLFTGATRHVILICSLCHNITMTLLWPDQVVRPCQEEAYARQCHEERLLAWRSAACTCHAVDTVCQPADLSCCGAPHAFL
jgi:hypothetical protein